MDAGDYVPDEVTNLMVRNRIDEHDAEPGFLLDGYPRTLAQVEELDGMIQFTGHQPRRRRRADRRRRTRSSRGCSQRAQVEGRADDTEDVIRRRQEVYAEQTEPLIEVYRGPRHPDRGRRHGRGRRRHPAHLRRARRQSPELRRADDGPAATAASRSRRPSRSTPMRAAGPGRRADPGAAARLGARRDHAPGSSTRSPRTTSASAGATPSFKGYHGLPGLDLRLGQRRGRARHPRRPGARRRRRDLDRLRRDRRRLARRRGDHGRGRRRRPPS